MKKFSIVFALLSIILLSSCERAVTDKASAVHGQWARLTYTYNVAKGETFSISKPLFDQCYTYCDFRKNGTYAAFYGQGMYQQGKLTVTEPYEQRGEAQSYGYKRNKLAFSGGAVTVEWLDDDCFCYKVSGQGETTVVYYCKITDFIEFTTAK